MTSYTQFWGNIKLPAWNLTDFHATFLRVRHGKRTPWDIDLLTRYLMLLIAIRIASRWMSALRINHIEPADAASQLLSGLSDNAMGLYNKVLNLNLIYESEEKVLIDYVNVIIHRDLISLLRKHNRPSAAKFVNEPIEIERPDHQSPAANVGSLGQALRNAEPALCKGDDDAKRIYPSMVQSLVDGEHLPTFDEISVKFDGTIDPDVHTAITYRLNKFIRSYAADLRLAAV